MGSGPSRGTIMGRSPDETKGAGGPTTTGAVGDPTRGVAGVLTCANADEEIASTEAVNHELDRRNRVRCSDGWERDVSNAFDTLAKRERIGKNSIVWIPDANL